MLQFSMESQPGVALTELIAFAQTYSYKYCAPPELEP